MKDVADGACILPWCGSENGLVVAVDEVTPFRVGMNMAIPGMTSLRLALRSFAMSTAILVMTAVMLAPWLMATASLSWALATAIQEPTLVFPEEHRLVTPVARKSTPVRREGRRLFRMARSQRASVREQRVAFREAWWKSNPNRSVDRHVQVASTATANSRVAGQPWWRMKGKTELPSSSDSIQIAAQTDPAAMQLDLAIPSLSLNGDWTADWAGAITSIGLTDFSELVSLPTNLGTSSSPLMLTSGEEPESGESATATFDVVPATGSQVASEPMNRGASRVQ